MILETPGGGRKQDAQEAAISSRTGRPRLVCIQEPAQEHQGEPMWRSFLEEVDIVLKAALPPEEWERLKAGGGKE